MKKYLFCLPVLWILFFILHKNQGFRPSKIFFPTELSFTDSSQKKIEIDHQIFHYLSKGRQCFVFISEDKTYVLKFLRFDKLQPPLWTRLFTNHQKIKEKDKRKLAWGLCFSNAEKLPLDLGILHSQLTKEKGTVTLKDNLGRSYLISLEHTRFFLQKKVTPLNVALLQENHPQEIIQSFLRSTAKRLNQNILNKTQSCMENVGWNGEKIIEFDFGEITAESFIPDKKEKFLSFTEPMKDWLAQNMTHLVSYFDQMRDQVLKTL